MELEGQHRIALNDKTVAALNAFDPYIYLSTLLHCSRKQTKTLVTFKSSLKDADHSFKASMLFPIGNFNPHLGASASFTITPLHNIDGQPSALSRGWNTKYINLTEAQLLYRLLECLSSSQYSHIEEVFTSYEMEEWAYRLAQLEWKKVNKENIFEGKKNHRS
ncbi:hypothetical protein L218DRAFT_946094 [Marasmius fiardii PR-910]|nr:hypothetical protein L218DRAFT_946094 [Marasmius fiardii PR-910]